jgi:hypothetical protein
MQPYCSLFRLPGDISFYSVFDIAAFIQALKERPQTVCERTGRCAAEKSENSLRHLLRTRR